MKRTTLSDTLVVSIGAVADNWFHFQCDTLCYLEIFGSRLKGQVGVALAAAGTAHFPDFQQRPGRHQVALSPGFLSERGGTGEDGHAHTGTDGSPAASPKPTGTTRHLASACHHFLQGRQQLDFTSGIAVGGQERSTDQRMMFRSVHVAERQTHPHLVEELLALSRLESGQFKADLHSTDIRELLYDCLRSTEHIAKQKGLHIIPCFDDSPITVVCDEIQLRRAFMNIITNALRYAREEIKIDCTQEKGKAVIRIRDDGEGISPELLPHIFDRFFSNRKSGTGIGLAFAKEIVALHKGSIRASNDNGAIFKIILPIG